MRAILGSKIEEKTEDASQGRISRRITDLLVDVPRLAKASRVSFAGYSFHLRSIANGLDKSAASNKID